MLLLLRIINNNNTTRHCLFDSFAVGTAACPHFAIPLIGCAARVPALCFWVSFVAVQIFMYYLFVALGSPLAVPFLFATPITEQLHFQWPQNVGLQVME